MAKAPAFQFYAGDFLTGTTLMSNAEVGLFIRLLCLQAEHGSIPDDVERIVRAYGEEARTLWTGVKPKFNPGSTAGTLVNARLCEVLAARDAFRQRQSEKGKASAAVRSSGSTKKKVRFNRGSTVVEPLGDGEGDEVLNQEGKERARELEWPSWAGPQTRGKWEDFKEYRRTLDRFRYKSKASEQAAINTLAKYFTKGQDMVAAIDEAMAKGWKFPVDPSAKRATMNGKPAELTYSEARKQLEEIRAKHGIAPGGFIDTHLIPQAIREAMQRPQQL